MRVDSIDSSVFPTTVEVQGDFFLVFTNESTQYKGERRLTASGDKLIKITQTEKLHDLITKKTVFFYKACDEWICS